MEIPGRPDTAVRTVSVASPARPVIPVTLGRLDHVGPPDRKDLVAIQELPGSLESKDRQVPQDSSVRWDPQGRPDHPERLDLLDSKAHL